MLVMIDNYDSFTHNLMRYFCELGQQVKVFRNDEISLDAIQAMQPTGLIISPGPGTPDSAGITLPAIEYFASRLPVLGVCLGHQAIGQVFGAKVERAAQVMHGKRSVIRNNGQGLFSGLPERFAVTRYHSLVLSRKDFPAELKIDAWVDDNPTTDIMAIRHAHLPVFGVQFHPESVVTEHGHFVLRRFCQSAGIAVTDLSIIPEYQGSLQQLGCNRS
ncbi:aminodeoxychorismate/anthranilate synthase component II [Aliidiomarina minuta]|uniref:Aminodeoxychorismate/anthranilate synthase component II n=1 Tax=Aliidiomarina minuta TaxID=880057 RepID=A0A432W421_9GAMM|nr:aminodeoxychorismate/anthranilate synthase component II [Aliidiomarina minuta]RUO24056.1 aminodeoxychorismate/anthranilate synthase component II [Aliidiomarina minuta]